MPLNGFVLLDDVERSVIDTFPFQRLRSIRQMGLTFLVYPGAIHSRFEHSLGTMELASQMFDLLRLKYRDKLSGAFSWNTEKDLENARQLLRLAALLHDIGHPPFSHSSEGVLPAGLSHEDYTIQIVQNSDVASKLRAAGLSIEELSDIAFIATRKVLRPEHARPEYVFLSQLISGDLGADRIDYLLRDCHHTGVEYGRFDYHRVLDTLEFAPPSTGEEERESQHIVEQGGLHAVEGMLLARYFMFLQVYYHQTRAVLERHLAQFYQDCSELQDGRFPGPQNLDEYLKWDDNRVLNLLGEARYREHYQRILGRQHYRRVDEWGPHAHRDEVIKYYWLRSELEKRFAGHVIFDEGERKEVYSYDILVRFVAGEKAGQLVPLVALASAQGSASELLAALQPIQFRRIYADRAKKQEIETFCQDFRNQRKNEGV